VAVWFEQVGEELVDLFGECDGLEVVGGGVTGGGSHHVREDDVEGYLILSDGFCDLFFSEVEGVGFYGDDVAIPAVFLWFVDGGEVDADGDPAG